MLSASVRKPYRDSKLTLYLRPFLHNTHVTLVGCLPPYDAAPSIALHDFAEPGVVMRGERNAAATNAMVFESIVKFCCAVLPRAQIRRLGGAADAKTRRVGTAKSSVKPAVKPVVKPAVKPAQPTPRRTVGPVRPSASATPHRSPGATLSADAFAEDLLAKCGWKVCLM